MHLIVKFSVSKLTRIISYTINVSFFFIVGDCGYLLTHYTYMSSCRLCIIVSSSFILLLCLFKSSWFCLPLYFYQTDGSVPNTLVIANCEVVKPRVAAAEHISQVMSL